MRLCVNHRLVFIGGLHRSGTSLLHRILTAHPDVSGFHGTGVPEDEGQHLQTVYAPAKAHGGPGRFAFDDDAHLTEQDADETDAPRLWRAWEPYWNLDCPVLIEKSPPNLIRTRYLRRCFPQAKFLMIMRHPVTVSLATRQFSTSSAKTILGLIRHWLVAHRIMEVDRKRVPEFMAIKYEDLVRSPDNTLEPILEFIGLRTARLPVDIIDPRRDHRYLALWNSIRMAPTRAISRAIYGRQVQRFGYHL